MMMNKNTYLAAYLALMAMPTYAIDLSIDPISQTVALGSLASFNVDINGLGNGTSLGTYDITIGFDPALLSYSTTTFGNQLDLSGLGDIQTSTPGSGNVEVYELSLESIADLNTLQATNFTLATLTFDTLAAGVNSQITLTINALGDASGNSITASIQNASVSINAASVPIPTAGWLFGSAFACFIGFSRRKLL